MEGMALTPGEDAARYSSSDDSSSDLDVEGTLDQVLEGSSEQRGKKDSWYKRLVVPKAKRGGYELSIQSGDIVRSPTPPSQASSRSPPAPCTCSPAGKSPTSLSPRPPPPVQPVVAAASITTGGVDGGERARGNILLASETAVPRGNVASETAVPSPSPPSRPSKGGLYGKLFPYLLIFVERAFLTVKVRCFRTFSLDIPVFSLVALVVNLFLIGAIGISIWFTSLSPRINVSIKSFGIPDHPAQLHWDAYNAATRSKFWNNLTYTEFQYGAVRKRRSSDDYSSHTLFKRSAFPNCPVNPYTQSRIHKNWEMDLVFRVPSHAAKDDDNILTVDRIKYIHSVEESIYNSTGYQDVCRLHRNRGSSRAYCYPLSSLLSWLYLRDPDTGEYVYHTSDGFTPNLTNSLLTISNLSVALWFTGGEATFNSDFSQVDAKLLRSEIRVGLPLKCFSGAGDRYDEQKQLITDYFVSLMPILEDMSTR